MAFHIKLGGPIAARMDIEQGATSGQGLLCDLCESFASFAVKSF
jgi:hypothetical protein